MVKGWGVTKSIKSMNFDPKSDWSIDFNTFNTHQKSIESVQRVSSIKCMQILKTLQTIKSEE